MRFLKTWLIAAALSLAPIMAVADTIQAVPLGCHTVTSFSTAQSLPTIDARATFMIASVEGNPIRYTDIGSAPTASSGVELPVGVFYYSGTLRNIQFIPTTGSSVINYCDYR